MADILCENIWIHDKLFEGKIDNKDDIRIYLKSGYSSDNNFNLYTVYGWYFRLSDSIKVPLIGIYDGNLTLFSFTSNDNYDTKFTMFIQKNQIDSIKKSTNYKEKIVIDKYKQGKWTNGKKSLKLEIFNSNISIENQTTYIKRYVNEGYSYINLNDLGLLDERYKIENYIKTDTEIKILLSYSYYYPNYFKKNCLNDFGYIILTLDNHFEFKNYKRYVLESCENGITFSKIEKIDNQYKVFEIIDNKQKSLITVDTDKLEIKTSP